jgi:hypothetical protein
MKHSHGNNARLNRVHFCEVILLHDGRGITLELSRAEREAFNLNFRKEDESHAVEAS